MVVGIIKHGSGQYIEAGIHGGEVEMSPLEHIDSGEHNGAVGHNAPSRLQDQLGRYAQVPAAALENWQHRRSQVGRGGGGAIRMVLDAQAPAQVNPLNAATRGSHGPGNVHHLGCRLGEGSGVQDLRAYMTVQAHRPDSVQFHSSLVGLCHLLGGDAELGGTQAGGDLGMGLGRDIGIDPE